MAASAFGVTPGTWPGSAGPVAANQQYGYPYPGAPDCNENTGANCVADTWRFYQGQCTSWVAYRLNQLNGFSFANSYGGRGLWGDASNWGPHAGIVGIAVNGAPAVGAVAWYSSGHVAYVEAVNSPTSVVISEMNYDDHNGFRVETISPGNHWPSGFIHIHDISSPPPPPPPLGAPSFLPPGAINRYYNSQTGDHWVTSGGAPGAGYGFESTLGFAALDPAPNERTLYSCLYGGDQFVSPDPACEGQRVVGPIGAVYTQPPPTGLQVVGLFRCTVNGSGEHFVSTRSDCEGQHLESLLGYVTASQDRFNRYVIAGDHVDTARGAPAGATLESTLGFVLPNGGQGLTALYSCTTGGDQFTSIDPGCEGRTVLGLEGWVYASPSKGWPQTSAIYRCTVNGSGEHFVSLDPNCEGQHVESLLGYLAQTHAALDRFFNPATGDHWVTARAVPGGYQFESRLGYVLQSGGPGRHALYSCLFGGDQFTSLDPNCEGQRVAGQDGWVYDSPPSGQSVVAIYRCTVNGSGEHFVSTRSDCEGQHLESRLGYIAATPGGALAPPPPTGVSGPSISGAAADGQTLHEGHGGWANAPTSWSYQWTRCDASGNSCVLISGATSQAYTLAASDIGHTIRVQEWATNASGTGGPATSSPTAVVTAVLSRQKGGTGPHAACVVPRLHHMTAAGATQALQRAHCRLGSVHKPRRVPRHRVLRVIRQSAAAGSRHQPGYKVTISLR